MARFPAAGAAWGTLLVAGAMGVRQDFYWPLARFLAASGLHVLTFDYRGSGFSRREPMRAETADLTDWAERDLPAMAGEAQRAAPGAPFFYFGHSLGGQLLGAMPGNDRVRAAVTVSSGSGYYPLNDRIPARARFFWFVAIPTLTPLFGYFPGRRPRMVGDLPRRVAWRWRRWCLHPEYLLAEGERYREAFGRVRAPILGYSIEDDDIITPPAIDALHAFYRNAAVERRHLTPAAGERFGHFGLFAERRGAPHWMEMRDWLAARR